MYNIKCTDLIFISVYIYLIYLYISIIINKSHKIQCHIYVYTVMLICTHTLANITYIHIT